MDRLSSYAARESEERTPEEQAEAEDKAAADLVEKLRISSENKKDEQSEPAPSDEAAESNPQTNGETPTDSDQTETQTQTDDSALSSAESTNGEAVKPKGVPSDVKLFEIFHEQVMNLVSMQRLAIQDVTALLVSLANLSL